MATDLLKFPTVKQGKKSGPIASFVTTKEKQKQRRKMILFKGKLTINNKKWKQDLAAWSLYYRTEIVLTAAGFIAGLIVGVII